MESASSRLLGEGILDARGVRFEGRTMPSRARVQRSGAALSAAAATAPPASPPVAEAGCFARVVLEAAGLRAGAYRVTSLQRREAACLRALRVRSPEAARRRLEDPAARDSALSALLIGVTAFFRDPEVFAALETAVLPALAARPSLRVWSAGCANGAELCSVVLLLAAAGLADRAHLLGTDCRRDALDEARVQARAVLPDHLQRRIEWKHADLTRIVEPGPWDLILCRNVAIYMEPATAAAIAAGLADALAPGGFLVVGRAERLDPRLGLAPRGRCIHRRREGSNDH